MRTLIFFLLSISLAAPVSGGEQAGGEAEALTVVTQACEEDGGGAESCTCVRETFAEQVVSKVSSPQAALFAAYIHIDDQAAMMQAMQSIDSGVMQEAAFAVSAAKPRLEACTERRAAADGEAADLPQGDDPRSRFIRQCAGRNGNAAICACIADRVRENLSEHELELMVDMRAAEARGEDPIPAIAEERGMTEQEAKEGLAPLTGRIASAMAAINPMSCVDMSGMDAPQ